MTAETMQAEANQVESNKLKAGHQLRLWPGVAVVAVMWLVRIWSDTGENSPAKIMAGKLFAPEIAVLLLLVWWLFGSRLRWFDRLNVSFAFVMIAVATIVIAGKDFPAMAQIVYALPVVATGWVAWLLISFAMPWRLRRDGLLLVLAGIGVYFSMLRMEGVTGTFQSKISWRWTPSSEAKLLSELKKSSPAPIVQEGSVAVEPIMLQPGDWPSFRGPQRDGRLTGVHIRTDWDASPPKEIWRHRVGPGWSSCSVVGQRLFTQEQRGEDEVVTCYDTRTGQEIWTHTDSTRFEEMVAGAGPRGTPTFHEGRIFAMGANGQLNCLDAATGKFYWCADIVKASSAKVPMWGFSSSPLVFQGLVMVYAGGPESKCMVAYRADSGDFAWTAGEGAASYCSPHSATLSGVEQVLLSTASGLASYEPQSGTILWEHRWVTQQARVVQPAILSETDLLLGTGMDGGTRRLTVGLQDGKWDISENWTTKSIKPYYNDLVVLGDYLYGFDNNIFMCVSLANGKMKWRARGYGNGQVLLITDDALLLILTEQGEVALVEAKPEKHTEVARFKAIEGKTWNHPVVAHGSLFVRNAEEIACFELPIAAEH